VVTLGPVFPYNKSYEGMTLSPGVLPGYWGLNSHLTP
jgi:hypothetical protein